MANPIFLPYNVYGQTNVQQRSHNALEYEKAAISGPKRPVSNIPRAYYVSQGNNQFGNMKPVEYRDASGMAVYSPIVYPNLVATTGPPSLVAVKDPKVKPPTTSSTPQPPPDLPQLEKTGINSVDKKTAPTVSSYRNKPSVMTRKKIERRVYLALAAFCVNPLFGPVALLLAWTAQNKFNSDKIGNEHEIDELLKASLGMSIVGFITTVLSLFLTLLGFLLSFGLSPTTFTFNSSQ